MRYIKINDLIVPESAIRWVGCSDLEIACLITVNIQDVGPRTVSGQAAIDIVMQLCPQMVEGKRMRFHRHRWAFHNLVGHSVLQLLAWVGLPKLGFKVHDSTVPRPVKK